MEQSLKDKVALVTGGTRGIGRAIAGQLAQAGASLALNYVRNEESANLAVEELSKSSPKVVALPANVGDPGAIAPLVEKTLEHFGKIDILIHNAAMGAFKPVHKLKLNQWELSLDINTKAFFLLVQKVYPVMEVNGGGTIIAISSLGSKRFIPNYGAIGVSKSALENLVRYFGVELASKGIRVNCVSGGLVDTDAVKFFPDYEKLKDEVVSRTPAGRLGEPDDIAEVVAFLASPSSKWIYGQTIVADGGLSLL